MTWNGEELGGGNFVCDYAYSSVAIPQCPGFLYETRQNTSCLKVLLFVPNSTDHPLCHTKGPRSSEVFTTLSHCSGFFNSSLVLSQSPKQTTGRGT
jgi:hypothetical protein